MTREQRLEKLIGNGKAWCYERLALRVVKRIQMTVSQWADAYRWLSGKGSAEIGRWRTERTPYLREIMDVMGDDKHHRIVVMKSNQIGITEAVINLIGWVIHLRQCPIMILLPTIETMEHWVGQKLQTLWTETEVIRDLMGSRSRDSSNRRDLKEFPGGILFLAGGNSPSSYAQRSARIVVLDDVDRFPQEVGDEGNPVSLARGRAKAFWNYKLIVISTPTIKGASHIEAEYERSDQRHYHVPCPHCGEYQELLWENLKWDSGIAKPWFVCRHHGCMIHEHEKPAMLFAGKWIAHNPGPATAGYHLNALYAPIGLGKSWAELVEDWLDAQGDLGKLRTFLNIELGLPWEDQRNKNIAIDILKQRAEPYKLRTLPQGCLLITAGVDTQDDRLAIQLVGWGTGQQAWTIDYVEIPGDPGREDLWKALDEYMAQPLQTSSGRDVPVSACAIDSGGHYTYAVYRHVHQAQNRMVLAVKGATTPNHVPIRKGSKIDYNWRGETYKKALPVWMVGTDTIKHRLFNLLAGDKSVPADERKVRFSVDLDEEFYKQLISEVFDPKKNRWIQRRGHKRHEVLDTWVYAFAAAHHPEIRIDRKSEADWERLAKMLETDSANVELLEKTGPSNTVNVHHKIPTHPIVPKRNNFTNRW